MKSVLAFVLLGISCLSGAQAETLLPNGRVDCFYFEVIEDAGSVSIREPQLPNVRGNLVSEYAVTTASLTETGLLIQGKYHFNLGDKQISSTDITLLVNPGVEYGSTLTSTGRDGKSASQKMTCR